MYKNNSYQFTFTNILKYKYIQIQKIHKKIPNKKNHIIKFEYICSKFEDLNVHFESLGTVMTHRVKFEDRLCILHGSKTR